MKVWKHLNGSVSNLLGRNVSKDVDPDVAMMASIRAKSALHANNLPDVGGILVTEGEPSALELHPNSFVTDAIISAWQNKDTFARFAQDVQMDIFKFPGSPPVVLNAGMLQELELLKRMCKNHLSRAIDKKNCNVWGHAPDAKKFDKIDF